MSAFDWRDEMSVGIKIIDEQHKQLIDTISALNEAIIAKKTDKTLKDTFSRLADYYQLHFSTEEDYMDKFACDGIPEHKAAHSYFIGHIKEMKSQLDADKRQLSLELVAFLEFWLIGHVMVMDRKYVQCFNDHGLK
jgi:hemerythrin